MTRSNDRTLIKTLGFADPDKRDPIHDLACQYLCQFEVQRRLIAYLAPPRTEPHPESAERRTRNTRLTTSYEPQIAKMEHPISRGTGRYKTTIGFADALLVWKAIRHVQGEVRDQVSVAVNAERLQEHRRRMSDYSCGCMPSIHLPACIAKGSGLAQSEEWRRYEQKEEYEARVEVADQRGVLVEVKVAEKSINELLRQVKLYREYLTVRWTLAALTYSVSEEAKEMLRSEGIEVIRLGAPFDAWCAQRAVRRGHHDNEAVF